MTKVITLALVLFFVALNATESVVFRLLPVALSWVVILGILLKRKKINPYPFSYIFLLATMVAIGILTTRKEISLQLQLFRVLSFFSLLVAYCLAVYDLSLRKNLLAVFIELVYTPMVLFVTLNLALFFAGFQGVIDGMTERSAKMLSYFGIYMDRVAFLLSGGINAYGTFLGTLFVSSLVGLGLIKRHRKWFVTGFVLSFFSLLLTDSRGPILFSILILLLLKFVYSKTSKPKFLWMIPLIGFVGPILLLSTLLLLANSPYAEIFSRSSGDLATGNSRGIIWAIAVSDLISFKPIHIWGYGEFGHYAAGMSQQYGPLAFGDIENAKYIHPHNSFLSIIFDYGYTGLALYILFQYAIINTIKKLWGINRKMAYLLLANLMYFNLIGISETAFGFYYQDPMYLFFMINTLTFLARYYIQKKINLHNV